MYSHSCIMLRFHFAMHSLTNTNYRRFGQHRRTDGRTDARLYVANDKDEVSTTSVDKEIITWWTWLQSNATRLVIITSILNISIYESWDCLVGDFLKYCVIFNNILVPDMENMWGISGHLSSWYSRSRLIGTRFVGIFG